SLKAAASLDAFASSRVDTWCSASMHLAFMAAGVLPVSFACRPSRAALRPSALLKSAATALTSGLAAASMLALASALPPAKDSLRVPQSPLGSAAVIAIPAIIGLSNSRVHSSRVKLFLSAIDHSPLYRLQLKQPQCVHEAALIAASCATNQAFSIAGLMTRRRQVARPVHRRRPIGRVP